jgi:hypothetical protein
LFFSWVVFSQTSQGLETDGRMESISSTNAVVSEWLAEA